MERLGRARHMLALGHGDEDPELVERHWQQSPARFHRFARPDLPGLRVWVNSLST